MLFLMSVIYIYIFRCSQRCVLQKNERKKDGDEEDDEEEAEVVCIALIRSCTV